MKQAGTIPSHAATSPLYFLHIPKTAGTSLTAVLEENFPVQQVCATSHWLDIMAQPQEQLRSYRFFRGHLYHFIHKILPQRPTYMTFLRDPIERAISHYEQIRRTPQHYQYEQVAAQSGIEEFLETPETARQVANFQTRMLALDMDPVAMAAAPECAGMSAEQFTSHLDEVAVAAQVMEACDLRLAIERLDSYRFVGLTERFDEGLELLSHTFDWPPMQRSKRLNVAPQRLRRGELAPSTLERLTELNALDIALYEHAQRLFEQRYRAMVNELIQERFDREALAAATQQPGYAEIQFGSRIIGSGWHPHELHPQHGGFRWSGPSPMSTIVTPLVATGAAQITIRLLASLDSAVMASLKVSINGYTIPLTRSLDSVGATILEGTIPPEATERRQVAEIALHVDRTVRPNEIDPANPDSRALGIAYSWLRISPREA